VSSVKEIGHSKLSEYGPTEEVEVVQEIELDGETIPATNPTLDLYISSKPEYERQLRAAERARNWTLVNSIREVTSKPLSVWLNGDDYDSQRVLDITKNADTLNQIPSFVLYNIPHRDCGGYSAHNSEISNSDYVEWVIGISEAVTSPSVIVIEPDALAQAGCLPKDLKEDRYSMIRDAARILGNNPNIHAYIDAGHPSWVEAKEMSTRLKNVDIDRVRGFSLNVSNYISTNNNIQYGSELSKLTGGANFIIDTSRNGSGPNENHEWCNPSGVSTGEAPYYSHKDGIKLDGALWIKTPGESDGNCNGGPNAGAFSADILIGLTAK